MGTALPEILVVDDDPTQLSVRAVVLRDAGFSVATVANAEAALELLRADRTGKGLRVIVTDHVLPGASGNAFVREVRKFRPSIPVLVISGMDEAEPEYAGLRVTFLHKPCAPEGLIMEVQKAMPARTRRAA